MKWIEMQKRRRKKKEKKEKWREKKKNESEESLKVMKSNHWPSCNSQGSNFELLLSISLWAKNLSLHYKPSKSPLWSIEVVHVNYVRLDPFRVRSQSCEVQPHHIM